MSAAGIAAGYVSAGTDFTGWLLSTGAFVFVDDGVRKILSPADNGTGLYGLAGDPKIRFDGSLLRSYAYPYTDFSQQYYRYYDGTFGNRIHQPAFQLGEGDYPSQRARYYRHRSDDDNALIYVADIRWYVAGAFGRGLQIELGDGDGTPITLDIVLSNLNYFGGINGTPDQAHDTYFGNVIGLGSGVLITSRRPSDPESVKALWWDGSAISVIGVPADTFGIHPLCRNGVDSALCTYQVNQPLAFYEDDGPADIFDFMGFDFISGSESYRNSLNAGLVTPGAIVNNTGGWIYGGAFEGYTNGVATIGTSGISRQKTTGRSGTFQSWGLQKSPNHSYPPGAAGGIHIRKLKPEYGGNYVIDYTSLFPNADIYDRFTVMDRAGRTKEDVFGFEVVQAFTFGQAHGNFSGFTGFLAKAACMTDAGPFVLGRLNQSQQASDETTVHTVCGLLNGSKHPAPEDNDSARPIGAGDMVFMDGRYSLDYGATWIRDPVPIGGAGSASSGAMSVNRTFRLTDQQRVAAVPL